MSITVKGVVITLVVFTLLALVVFALTAPMVSHKKSDTVGLTTVI